MTILASIGAWVVGKVANLWARVQFYLLLAAGAAAALVFAYFKGRTAGEQAVVEKEKQQRADAIVDRKQSDDQVNAAPPAAVDAGLNQWMRD